MLAHFGYWAVTIYGRPFQVVCLCLSNRISKSYNPSSKLEVWAIPGSLATTTGISFDFFSSVNEMFQFTEYTFAAPEVQDHRPFRLWSFLIRKSSAGSACLAADRSISQLATSFIGIGSRGIRVMR